ncbi:MAG: ankyrin repeat domain-containing protein, partial [Planctomycetota bacterium]
MAGELQKEDFDVRPMRETSPRVVTCLRRVSIVAALGLVIVAPVGCPRDDEQLAKALRKAEKEFERGLTPLHQAARDGQVDKVKELLGRGADTEAKAAHGGHTPLHFATYPQTVTRFLGWLGPEPSEDDRKVRDERCVAVCRLLIDKGADVNAADERGAPPLAGTAA